MGCGASRGAPKPETTEHRVLERAASASTCTAGTGAAAVHATPPALALVSTAPPPPQLLLDSGVPDELILRVLSCLGAADLACLECVSRRFAGVSSTSDGGVEWFPARPATQWSIVQEAARRRLVRCSGNPDCTTMQWEPHSLPCVAHSVLCGARCLCRPRWQHPMPEDQGKERWVQLAYELELAQLPLTFDRSDATIAVSEGGALATKIVAGVTGGAVASSRKIMRTGRHFAEFTVVQPDGNAFAGRFGLIRPGKVPPAAARTSEFREAFSVKEVSFEVVPSGGSPMHGTRNREAWHEAIGVGGVQRKSSPAGSPAGRGGGFEQGGCANSRAKESLVIGDTSFSRYAGDPDPGHYYRNKGDRIGLCLELDPPYSGELTVYRNDEYLGLVATSLSGEYCWAVDLFAAGTSVRITPKPAPPRILPSVTQSKDGSLLVQHAHRSPLQARLESLLVGPEVYFQSKRAADFALSRAGLVQSGSLSGIVELDKTARELGDVGYLHHSASEDEDLNDELDLMQPQGFQTWEDSPAEAEAAAHRRSILQAARKSAAKKARMKAQMSTDLKAEREAAAAAANLERRHENWALQRAVLVVEYRRQRDYYNRYIPSAEWNGPIPGMAFKLDPQCGVGYYPDDLPLRYYNKEKTVQDFQQQVLRLLRQWVLRRYAMAAGDTIRGPGEEGEEAEVAEAGEEDEEADGEQPSHYAPRKKVKSKRGKTASWFGAE